jgi:hypothetical protein
MCVAGFSVALFTRSVPGVTPLYSTISDVDPVLHPRTEQNPIKATVQKDHSYLHRHRHRHRHRR